MRKLVPIIDVTYLTFARIIHDADLGYAGIFHGTAFPSARIILCMHLDHTRLDLDFNLTVNAPIASSLCSINL